MKGLKIEENDWHGLLASLWKCRQHVHFENTQTEKKQCQIEAYWLAILLKRGIPLTAVFDDVFGKNDKGLWYIKINLHFTADTSLAVR